MNIGVAVGCSRYDDPRVADLKYAHSDADRFAERLTEVAGVDAMVVLRDGVADNTLLPTRSNVVRVLAALPQLVAEPIDTLYFFFSGHGFHSTADDCDYLLVADSIGDVLDETSVRFELVLKLLRKVGARHVLLFLDACRAAASGGKSAAPAMAAVEELSPPGMVSFCSCEPGTVSYEADELGAGIFTAAVVDALGEAGRCVTVQDLAGYLDTAVPALSRRTGKPRQNPHTRVEPLQVKDLELVTAVVRNSWQSAVTVGVELRPTPAKPSLTAAPDPLVAIDLGTTYSAIALSDPDGVVSMVPGLDGRVLTPSVVSFTDDLDYVVGAPAVEWEQRRPERTVRNVKRLLGTDRPAKIDDRTLPPELVSSLIVRSLRDSATEAIGAPVRRCMVAYPANFGIAQVNAMQRAFELAGMDVARMVGEPNIAAVLLLLARPDFEGTCLIVDLGGGTFDVAYAEFGDGVCEIRSVAGSNTLGGLDYDEVILGVVRKRLADARPGLVLGELMTAELRREAERAKRLLSGRYEAVIVVRDLPTEHGLEDVEILVRREEIRAAVRHLDDEVRRVLHAALEEQNALSPDWQPIPPDQVDLVLFTGQGGKMFTVREAIRSIGVTGEFVDQYQELGVVRGLAAYINVLTGHEKNMLLLDLTHRGIGFRTQGAVTVGGMTRCRKTASEPDGVSVVIEQLMTIPTKRSLMFTFLGGAAEPLTLDLVERSKIDDEFIEIGTIVVPAPGKEVRVEVIIDIDANNMLVLRMMDLTNRVVRPYQLNQHYRGPENTWVDPGQRVGKLLDGWTLHPVRSIQLAGVTTGDSIGDTFATIDPARELAELHDPDYALPRGRLLVRMGRHAEALAALRPMLAERPRIEWAPPEELCTAICDALGPLRSDRAAVVGELAARLTHSVTVDSYTADRKAVLTRCAARMRTLGRFPEVDQLAKAVKAMP